jgi:Anti-sigma factor NepR
VTDSGRGLPNSQGPKQLPRHRQLLAEAELRRVFNQIVELPVPKEFLVLLQQIDARHAIEEAV